ncbi:MAG: translation initiation factor IF-5A [Candidatus Aenigmarchaeota archaeon]|nr:translation initiation factor IF-5A [Candidatus Aenigmarchaeota archaeon]
MEKRSTEIKDLKEGGFILIDEAPCRVEDVQISKAGKHGSAKARLTAVGIFDGIKRIIVKPGSAKVDVPIVEKKSMQVVAITGNNVQLMDLETYDMSEVPIPDELKGKLIEGGEILVWKFGANVLIKGAK